MLQVLKRINASIRNNLVSNWWIKRCNLPFILKLKSTNSKSKEGIHSSQNTALCDSFWEPPNLTWVMSAVIQHIGPCYGNTEFIKKKRNKQRKPKKKCISSTKSYGSLHSFYFQHLFFFHWKKTIPDILARQEIRKEIGTWLFSGKVSE